MNDAGITLPIGFAGVDIEGGPHEEEMEAWYLECSPPFFHHARVLSKSLYSIPVAGCHERLFSMRLVRLSTFKGPFPVWEQDAEITVDLHPKCSTSYALCLVFEMENPPKEYFFDGKLRIELLHGEAMVETFVFGPGKGLQTISSANEVDVYLAYFSLPLNELYWKNLKLRVTVLEPARNMLQYSKTLQLRVGNGFNPKTL
jgi:hypothetical protein